MRNTTIVLAIVAVVVMATAGPSYGVHYWNTTTAGDWHNTANWNPTSLPGSGDLARLWSGGDATISSATPVSIDRMEVRISKVNILAGTTVTMGSSGLYIGDAQVIGSGPDEVIQSGGAVTVNGTTFIGRNTSSSDYDRGYGVYEISGGSFTTGDDDVILGRQGSGGGYGKGIFRVKGGGATGPGNIQIGGDLAMESGISSLEFEFDGDSDPIQHIGVTGNVTLDGTIAVTGTATGGPHTILSWSGSETDNTFTVTLPDASWSWNDGLEGRTSWKDDNAIIVTIPEPATMVLLGIGGLGVLIRRRRK